MESIPELQINSNNLQKRKNLTLRSFLDLSNQKSKYKKQYLHLDSLQKNNDTCEVTGISRINSITPNNAPISTTPNKRPKFTVSFAPRFRFINYIYYDPEEPIYKEENKNQETIKEENEKNDINKNQTEKINLQCTCYLI